MRTGDLFEGMDLSAPLTPSLKRARALVGDVDLLFISLDDFEGDVRRVVKEARNLRAWSVARAVTWMYQAQATGRGGMEETHIRAERVARGWLRRVERAAMGGA